MRRNDGRGEVPGVRGSMSHFSGSTYQPELDYTRLTNLAAAVKRLVIDGEWRTLGEIKEAIGFGGEASISARLRDLRNKHGFCVQRRRRGEPSAGLFEYKVTETLWPQN